MADLICIRATGDNIRNAPRRGLYTHRGIDLSLLRDQQHNGITDPHDKVYGVAGLLEPWANGKLAVDYNRSVGEVYGEGSNSLWSNMAFTPCESSATSSGFPRVRESSCPLVPRYESNNR